ncbi:hypothetical protein J6590_062159 [Homalodisca vitripennis]|nr:hypothetical protein J6590_062159 [Homalodisca vitripennis]
MFKIYISTTSGFGGLVVKALAIGSRDLWYHPECVNIDNETYAAINDIADKVKWFCADCEVKLEMLFRKSTKIDDGCDWPSIINVVLTELENQSKNNVALCGRIDNLTSNYQKLNTELVEVKASHKALNTLVSKTWGIKIMDSMHEPNTTEFPPLKENTYRIHKNTDISNNKKTNSSARTLCQGPSRSAEVEEKQPDNKNITYSRIIRNSVLNSKTDEDNKVNENCEIESNFEVYVSRKRRSAMNRAQNRKSISNATSREALASRPIFGKKTGSGTKLKTASKRSWVFISRLDTSVTKENIESYLKDSQIDDFLCFELETKYDTYKSFKIGVNDSAVDQIMDPEFWDEGILVKEYIPLRKQHRGHFLGHQRG